MKILKAQSKYMKILSVGFLNSIEYRMDFLLGLLSCFFPIVIQFYMWTAIYSGKDTVLKYTYNQMLIYAVLAALITKMVSTGFEGEINNDIRNGGLSKYVIQPISYFFYRACKFIGEKLVHLIIVFFLIMSFLFYFQLTGDIVIEFSKILLFILVIFLALILKFLIFYAVSVIAFWMQECGGLFIAIDVISMVIAGGIFPLDIFGETVVLISKYLPFYYLTYFPVKILNGMFEYSDIYSGIIIQLIWILLLLIAIKGLWRVGMKKYIAAGG